MHDLPHHAEVMVGKIIAKQISKARRITIFLLGRPAFRAKLPMARGVTGGLHQLVWAAIPTLR
jgi:hypothetical protein